MVQEIKIINSRSNLVSLRGKKLRKAGERQEEMMTIVYWYYSLFEDKQVTGKIKKVFLRGKKIVDDEKCLGISGQGNFLKRKEFCGF